MPEHSFVRVWATRRPDAGSDTLVQLADGSGAPIFCFHTENGGTGELRELGDAIRDNRPLYATEAIGLRDRSTPPATVAETVARHLRDIRRVQATGPYRLLGLGSGGRLAHEAARQLHTAGEHIAVLAMVDTPAPGGQDLGRHRDLRDLYDFRLDVLSRVFGTRDAHALIAEMSTVGWAESDTDPTSFHWHQVIWAAARLADAEHIPVRYPGTAMLIQSAATPRDQGWRPLVGQLRTRTVATEGLREILRDRRTVDGLRRVFGLTGQGGHGDPVDRTAPVVPGGPVRPGGLAGSVGPASSAGSASSGDSAGWTNAAGSAGSADSASSARSARSAGSSRAGVPDVPGTPPGPPGPPVSSVPPAPPAPPVPSESRSRTPPHRRGTRRATSAPPRPVAPPPPFSVISRADPAEPVGRLRRPEPGRRPVPGPVGQNAPRRVSHCSGMGDSGRIHERY